MTTFAEQITNLATRSATECRALHTKIGQLASLTTTDKTSVVSALNEIKTQANTAASSVNDLASRLGSVESQQSTNTGDISTIRSSVVTLQSTVAGLQTSVTDLEKAFESVSEIDDANVSTVTTYSSSKITDAINTAKQAVKNDLLGGAGEAVDTLKELADLIETNADAITALENLASGHVKYDAVQSLTDAQKERARANIGAAKAADVITLQTAVSGLQTAVVANTSDISGLESSIGDTSVDFVAIFEAALNAQ